MFFVACTIALFCSVSAGVNHSAPLPCAELVRPLDQLDLHHLEGRWVLIAGSMSHPSYLEQFKQRDSATVNFPSNINDTNISYTRSIRLDNKCLYSSYNISLNGSSFTYEGTERSNFSSNFAHTSCHDCMVMHLKVESEKREHLYLSSRRREVEEKEMEEFRAQVACLNMPPPAVLHPTMELCPEETADDPAAQTEEKTDGQNN